MSWIVPVPLLSLLTAKQLEQMVCGMPEICCDVLKKVVRYREVDEQHSLVQWFWQTLEEFSNEERVLFMRFVSGRSRLPANTADISQRFQIMKVDRVSESGAMLCSSSVADIWKTLQHRYQEVKKHKAVRQSNLQ